MQTTEKRVLNGKMAVVCAIVMVMMTMAAGLVSPAAAAPLKQGQQGEVTGRWIFKLRVTKGQIEAVRINQELHDDTVVAQSTEVVSCQTVGAVVVNNSSIDFNGGTVECNMPSFRQAFFDLSGYVVPPASSVGGDEVNPWVIVDVSNVDTTVSQLPIINDDATAIKYGLTTAGGGPQAQLKLDGTLVQGPVMALSGTDRIGTRVNSCNGVQCTETHGLNSRLIENSPMAQVPFWTVSNEAHTLIIGANGAHSFLGTIHTIHYDPNVPVRPG